MQKRVLDKATEYKMRVLTAKRELDLHPDLSPDEKMDLAMDFEPDADATKAFDQFMSEKHKKRTEDVIVQGTDEMVEAAEAFVGIQEQSKLLDSAKMLHQNVIKQYMEKHGATIMMLPNGKVTWRTKFTVKL